MKMKTLAIAMAVPCCLPALRSEASDGLSNAVRKAKWVVAAEVIDAPKRWAPGEMTYVLHIKFLEVIKGELSNKEIYGRFNTAGLRRFPYLKTGNKCIVFLKRPANDGSPVVTMPEPWTIFCIQPYSTAKIAAVKRVR
jgi:hypothetical protein